MSTSQFTEVITASDLVSPPPHSNDEFTTIITETSLLEDDTPQPPILTTTLSNIIIKCSQHSKNIRTLSMQNLSLGKIPSNSNISIPCIDTNDLQQNQSKDLGHKCRNYWTKQIIYKKENPPLNRNLNNICIR